MTDALAEVRRHVAAAHGLLERLCGDERQAAPAGQPPEWQRAGVEIDPTTFAELVTLAERLGMAPGLVLKLALRALEVELGRPMREKATRLVGAERGLLEGKR